MWSEHAEMREKVAEAYRHFAIRSTFVQGKRRFHECSNECHWFQLGRVFICRENGFVHVCTTEFCDRFVIGRSERCCSWTGLLYPLELVEEYTDHCVKQLDGTSRGPTGVVSVPATPNVTENTFLSVLWDLCRIQHEKQEEVEQRLGGPQVATFVSRICLHLWYLIKDTAYYRENTTKYQADYHGVVVIYIMRDTGLSFEEGQPVLLAPFLKTLRNALPNLKSISKSNRWRCARFTPADKIFRACVAQLTDPVLSTYHSWLMCLANQLHIDVCTS